MEILSLELISFGKFKNKNLDLKPGINIIHGYNEAGKTTISDFIFGMFYDFIKPGRKRTAYSEKKERYTPLEGPYLGAMELKFQGRHYRLERNFEKKKEDLRIFLVDEGREITEEINVFKTSRIPQCGEYFLGFGQEIFSNTSYIGQLSLLTPSMEMELDSLWNELNHKEEGSIRNRVLSRLEEKREQLGKESRKSTEIGYLRFSLEENEKAQRELLPYIRKYRSMEKEFSATLDRKNIIEEEKNTLIQLDEQWEKYKTYQDFEKLQVLREKEKQLQKELSLGQVLNHEFLEDRDIFIKNREELRVLYPQLDYHQLEYNKISKERKNLDFSDCEIFRNLQEPKADIGEKEDLLSLHKARKRNLERTMNKNYILSLVGFILSLVLIYVIYTFHKFFIFLPLLLCLGIFGAFFLKGQKQKKELQHLQYKIETLQKDIQIFYNDKENWDRFWERTSKKYGFSSVEEGFSLFYQEKGNNFQKERQRDEILRRIKELEKRIAILEEDQKNFYTKYPTIREEELEKAHGQFEKQKNMEKDLALLSQSILDMEDKISGKEIKAIEEPKEYTHEEVKLQLSQVDRQWKILEKEIIRIKEGLHQLEGYIQSWANLKEEKLQLEEKFKELDKEKRALDLTIKGFVESSKKFGKEYRKEFKDVLDQYLSIMTDERYDSLIMNQGEPSILERESMIRKDGSFLSTGTLDQVYLAYRLAMAKYFGDGRSPLLLDDTMNHFDHNRLLHTWKLLANLGAQRQIIFFTSRKEEFPPSFISYHTLVLEEEI